MYSNAQSTNIVWIIIEDMSPDLSSYGHEIVRTPVIDGLAKKGIRYNNVYATGAACSPSRTALVTGYYQNYIGAYHMRYPEDLKPALPDSILPIHIHLKKNGYQTANIRSFPGNGKTDWLFKFNSNSYDFSYWDEIDPKKPFFARINIRLAHRPFERDLQNPIDPDRVVVPPYYPDHLIAREDFRQYYESIQVMDSQVGIILSELKNKNLDRNTLIFLFSDHGRPMTRGKNYLYDSGIQVPLIIASLDADLQEKFQLEGSNSALFSLIDVTATTLDVAGMDNIRTQGVSVLRHPHGREYVWSAVDRMGEIHFRSRMVRDSRFKYIRNYIHDLSINEASTAYRKATHPIYHLLNILGERGDLNTIQQNLLNPMVPEELYDIKTDPFEIHNLVENKDYQEVLQRLRITQGNLANEIQDKGMEEDPPEIISAFNEYGRSSLERYKMRILELRDTVQEVVNLNQY